MMWVAHRRGCSLQEVSSWPQHLFAMWAAFYIEGHADAEEDRRADLLAVTVRQAAGDRTVKFRDYIPKRDIEQMIGLDNPSPGEKLRAAMAAFRKPHADRRNRSTHHRQPHRTG